MLTRLSLPQVRFFLTLNLQHDVLLFTWYDVLALSYVLTQLLSALSLQTTFAIRVSRLLLLMVSTSWVATILTPTTLQGNSV